MLGSISLPRFKKAAPAAVQSTSDIETGNESHFQLALIHIMDIIDHFKTVHCTVVLFWERYRSIY